MGDFDKNLPTDTPANDKRKQILVGILGAVLLFVVGFHFLKGSPETASANNTPNGTADLFAPAHPTQTAADEARDLVNDPTAHLLLGTPALDPKWADPPHDPFLVSERFRERAKIVPQADPAPVATTHPSLPAVPAPAIAANTLKIEGIFHVGPKLQAIVNGAIVTPGMTIGDALVVDIQNDRITVRHKDWPDGPTTTVTLQPISK